MVAEKSPDPPKSKKKSRHTSEWLEKALLETKSRRRRSKKVANPDFVDTDVALSSKDTHTKVLLDASVPDTDEVKQDVPKLEETQEATSSGTLLSDSSQSTVEKPNEVSKKGPTMKKSRGRPRLSRSGRETSSSDTEWVEKPKIESPDIPSSSRSTRHSQRVQKLLETASPASISRMNVEEDPTDNDPESSDNKDIIHLDKDKYCWFCHKEVIGDSQDERRCKSCHKVFHERCGNEFVLKTEWLTAGGEWECQPCTQYAELRDNNVWAPYVEYLGYDKYIKQLRYIIEKLKKYPSSEELLRPVNTRLFPDYPQYIAHPVHFEKIEQRLNQGEYRCVDTMYEDFRWMVHNSVIFNGGSSAITKDLRCLLKNLRMELYDLDSCACCYIHAYTRPELWFILPCPTPHLLVWAQLKGFPYWPAKVYDSHLEQRPGEILVKFFGDHARSWISYDNIYLYSLDPPSVCPSKKKKKMNMISSLVEMDKHVEMLRKQFTVFKYPEQDILIGTNPKERALQLKYMLPSCGNNLLRKPCAIPSISLPVVKTASNPQPPDQKVPLDLKDASSKRDMLSMLAERVQQARSDSEDSVKSFRKVNKDCRVANSNTQRSMRHDLLFRTLERNQKRTNKIQMKRHKKSRPVQYPTGAGHAEVKAASPKCGDIDSFIETHLASSQKTSVSEDTDVIPAILKLRNRRGLTVETKQSPGNTSAGVTANSQVKAHRTAGRKKSNETKKPTSLRLNQRLFRHKKYSNQLFLFRKLGYRYHETQRREEVPPTPAVDDIAKYFDVGKVKTIQSPRVELTSMSVADIKALKREVKMRNTKILRKKSQPPEPSTPDPGFVPLEETAEISTEAQGMDVAPASEVELSSEDDLSDSEIASSSGNTQTSKPCAFPGLDFKLKADRSQHRFQMLKLMKAMTKPKADRFNVNMMVSVENIHKMTEMLLELKNQNQICLDTQYNTALQSAEMVLYSEYASMYSCPPLKPEDYDDVFTPPY